LPLYATLVATLGVSIYARTAFDMFEVWMNHPGVYWMTLAFYSETADYVNRSPDSTPLDFNMDVYVPWRRTNLQRPIEREDVAVRWTINDAFVFPEHPDGLRVAFQIHAPPSPVLQETFFDDPDKPLHVGPRVDPTGQHILRVYGISRARLDAHLERAQDGPVFLPYTGTPVDSSVTAGDWLEFLGYEILNPEGRPGEGLHVITYWRVIRPPPALAVFLHLLDRDGNLVAQFDGFDVVFDDLAPGDVVAQLHTLGLPPDLPDDEYRLQIGGYRREDLERLPLSVDAADNLLWLRTWRPMSGSGEGP